ncbi:MAG: YmdB family metallophosphoesterase, partial [Clostridia bacterium]|nr:YmdB family metallophosphoesterase [Clostridia bacterium]
MKLLLLGDIVGRKTVEFLQKNLWALRREHKIDMVVANGENATDIMGLSAEDAKTLLDSGVDVLTGGNH